MCVYYFINTTTTITIAIITIITTKELSHIPCPVLSL